MSAALPPRLHCHGCTASFDPLEVLAFRCPNAEPGDDVDHVLEPVVPGRRWPEGDEPDPFVRYRGLTLAGRLAGLAGMSDGELVALVEDLDRAVQRVDGRGFRITPWQHSEALACRVKDETDNVAGSHKGRHLQGVMIYLRVLEETGLLGGAALRRRPLAIASCGNAALAAAVVARAADWPLQVFVPTDAEAAVLERLAALGADVRTCPRTPGVPGDPAVHALHEALRAGALPFTVQGDENGLAVEGGRTLAWELVDQGQLPDALFVQVGGGALASAAWQGLRDGLALGRLDRLPRLYTVQTEGAAPLQRAWLHLRDRDLGTAARSRSAFMWPWESVPHSLAHGILDDETYDWWACCQGMRKTGGEALVVPEAAIEAAWREAWAAGFHVSPTGSAGLAGLRAAPLRPGTPAGVLLTGVGGPPPA